MKGSEPKWVKSMLKIIGVNSFRLKGLHIKIKGAYVQNRNQPSHYDDNTATQWTIDVETQKKLWDLSKFYEKLIFQLETCKE